MPWAELLIGTVLGGLVVLLGNLIKIIVTIWMARRGFSLDIKGNWFSAEYDIKSEDVSSRNTILIVKIKKQLLGAYKICTKKTLHNANPEEPTGWTAIGELHGDSLIGKWITTRPYTKRYGTAMIKFFDNGRAAGSWIGLAKFDYPVYGYWIMSRNKKI